MKYTPLVFLTLAIGYSASAEQPQPAKKSNEVAPVVTQSTQASKSSALKQSLVLSDGVNWTLIPRSSVVHRGQPEEGRFDARPVGVLCSWKQFLSLNNSWLVGMEKAEFDAFAAESPSSLDLETRVIIALEDGKPAPLTK